jgi:hypothetical protein
MGLALHQVCTDDSKSDAVVDGVHPVRMAIGGGDPDRASEESAGGHGVGRRNAKDLNLTGTEVHSLSETLETVIFEMEGKIAGLADLGARMEPGKSRNTLWSIKDELPAGLIETG